MNIAYSLKKNLSRPPWASCVCVEASKGLEGGIGPADWLKEYKITKNYIFSKDILKPSFISFFTHKVHLIFSQSNRKI